MVLCLVTLTDLQTRCAGLSASAELLVPLRTLVARPDCGRYAKTRAAYFGRLYACMSTVCVVSAWKLVKGFRVPGTENRHSRLFCL